MTKLSVKNKSTTCSKASRLPHAADAAALGAAPLLRHAVPKAACVAGKMATRRLRKHHRSRAAIWQILADPRKFIESNLMAGA